VLLVQNPNVLVPGEGKRFELAYVLCNSAFEIFFIIDGNFEAMLIFLAKNLNYILIKLESNSKFAGLGDKKLAALHVIGDSRFELGSK